MLKDSFPFDGKTLKARNVYTLKASTKATAADTSVNATFESTDKTEAKVEAVSECKASNLTIKESFSTKDSTATVSATVADKLGAGSKVSVEAKVSRKDTATTVVVNPAFELVNETVALRLKAELPISNLVGGWKTEVAGTFRREKVQVGVQAKLQAGESLLESYAGTAQFVAGSSTFTLGAVGEQVAVGEHEKSFGHSLVATYFQKFCSDCDGRVATELKVPTTFVNPTVRTALLWNVNKDTTTGVFVDNNLNLASSLRVKVNDNVTVYGSAWAPLATLAATSAGERVFGFGVEFSA